MCYTKYDDFGWQSFTNCSSFEFCFFQLFCVSLSGVELLYEVKRDNNKTINEKM